MRLTLWLNWQAAFCLVLVVWVLIHDASEASFEDPLNYDTHIAGILKTKCGVCHGDGKQEAGLNLASYAGVVQGGGSGKIVVAGQPTQSKLIEVVTSEDTSIRMPPDGDPLTKEQIGVIEAWISKGLRENAGSSAAQMRTLGFVPQADSNPLDPTNPGLPGPIPQNYPPTQTIPTARPLPIVALAASPRALLIAASRYGAIDLLDPVSCESVGTLGFPEGEPLNLSFSRSGRVLMAAGGKPVRSGSATLYDVVSGKRLASLGDESDAILSADLSPDERSVAIGCTSRLVKIHSTETGELITTIDKHTDWVTAVAFSPDGRTLATADRVGNVYLWDSRSGGALLSLSAHKKSVRSVHWRSDSQVLVSCGEDGLVVWWDAKEGWPSIQRPEAHAQGVLDAKFGNGGELATCGRDQLVKYWSADGTELKRFGLETASDQIPGVKRLPLRVAISSDGGSLIAGDTNGQLHRWSLK
ncbi:MAG: hypothetical protein NTV29_03795 [Planctomycetota bacterium]|nr:hypothetical protein [Planctomycetota bacterium]